MGYNLLYFLAIVILWPVVLWRVAVRGKYRQSMGKRWGRVPPRTPVEPPRRRIWLHAVSVGEAIAARPLVAMIEAERPAWEVVISTTTETGQAVAAESFGEDRVFYCPFDFSWTVRRALDRIRPSALVLMELELWPNLIREAHARGIPVIVANGRISESSFRGYRRFRGLFAGTLSRVSRFAVQTAEYADRLRELGIEDGRIVVTGSVKYDAIATDPDPEARGAAREELGLGSGEPVVLAGSIHPGEDGALLEALKALRGGFPDLALVLVPRHPERLPSVEAAIGSAGFEAVRKTALDGGKQRPPGAVVLVDTMGELGRLYAAADVVYVGGSLIEHGGQSVMEPAGLAKPCVFGPHMWNFKDAVDALLAEGAARQISRGEELSGALEALLADPAEAGRMGEAARSAMEARKGATKRNFEVLIEALE